MGYSGQTEYHDLARSAQTQKGLFERCPERIPDGMIVLALSLLGSDTIIILTPKKPVIIYHLGGREGGRVRVGGFDV